uniref:Cytochrome c oxidase subunit 2 n=1 Tax=Echinoderes svetlanae TaxID=1912903 RepID=A0A1I9VTU5_9BILA|nr:cytochrome c oxidase subunit II [Echinoderes svetlanae]APA17418.1 cytochrome c oxidase subunit 2 [Echinoderes svetlanae]
MSYYGSSWMQDPSTYICANMYVFFNYSLLLVMLISGLVGYWMWKVVVSKVSYNRFIEHESLEVWWTCVPVMTLIFIGVPSLRLLYMYDCQPGKSLCLKVIGRQWYWSYEYGRLGIFFDSFPININDLNVGGFRIMDVDTRVVLPGEVPVRVMVTAGDVLHSWAVPSFGVKVDAVPGRLNVFRMNAINPGVYYGQCSELCGVGHSIMPIVVEVVSWSAFVDWVNKMI